MAKGKGGFKEAVKNAKADLASKTKGKKNCKGGKC